MKQLLIVKWPSISTHINCTLRLTVALQTLVFPTVKCFEISTIRLQHIWDSISNKPKSYWCFVRHQASVVSCQLSHVEYFYRYDMHICETVKRLYRVTSIAHSFALLLLELNWDFWAHKRKFVSLTLRRYVLWQLLTRVQSFACGLYGL